VFLCLKESSTKVLAKLIKLLDTISSSRYPPLKNGVHNVNSDIVVKTKEQAIRAYSCCIASTIIVYKLGKREETCLHSLVFGYIGLQVVFDDLI